MRNTFSFQSPPFAIVLASVIVLAGCEQPFDARTNPQPVRAPEIASLTSPGPVDPGAVARAQRVLSELLAQYNTPGSSVRNDATRAMPQARAIRTEMEREGDASRSSSALIEMVRRLAGESGREVQEHSSPPR